MNAGFQILNNFEVPPPEGVWDSIKNVLDSDMQGKPGWLGSVYNYEVPAPGDSWEAICSQLGDTKNKTADQPRIVALKPNNQSNVLRNWMLGAAAAAVLGFGIFLLNRNDPSAELVIQNNQSPVNQVTDTAAVIEKSPVTRDEKAEALSPARKMVAERRSRHLSHNKPVFESLSRDANSIPYEVLNIENEDEFFVVLASYINNSNLNPTKPLRFRIDDITNIYFSPKLQGFMRKMYNVNRHGRPSATARRHFRKFRTWKKVVNKEFNVQDPRSSSISDPVDLTNFLEKNTN